MNLDCTWLKNCEVKFMDEKRFAIICYYLACGCICLNGRLFVVFWQWNHFEIGFILCLISIIGSLIVRLVSQKIQTGSFLPIYEGWKKCLLISLIASISILALFIKDYFEPDFIHGALAVLLALAVFMASFEIQSDLITGKSSANSSNSSNNPSKT